MPNHPIVLTSRQLVEDFDYLDYFDLKIVDDLRHVDKAEDCELINPKLYPTEPAASMLTPGSSGNLKLIK